jgi:hypothetical protein
MDHPQQSGDDEASAVERWLGQQGYPLELRVGRTFRGAGWNVQQVLWYKDADSGKLRELDLMASHWTTDESGKHSVVLEAAVECKSSKGKPWVGFTSPREKVPSILQPTAVADEFSRATLFVAAAKKVPIPKILRPRGRLAHGLVKTHSEGRTGDPTSPFAAIHSVVGATRAIGDERSHVSLLSPDYLMLHVIVPVIVLDGSLYEYSLDEGGTEQLAPVDRMPVATPSASSYDAPVVWIVRHHALPDFLRDFKAEGGDFARALLPHIPDVMMLAKDRAERVAARTESSSS